MRRAAFVFVGALMGCGAAAPSVSTPHTDVRARAVTFRCDDWDPDEDTFDLSSLDECLSDERARAAVAFVYSAAALEHDVDAYLGLFDDDAVRVFARWASASPHDVAVDRGRYETGLRSDAAAGVDPAEVAFERVFVELEPDGARVHVVTWYRWGSGEDTVVEGQEYALDQGERTWRIVSLRTWLERWGSTDEGEVFTEATWTEGDALVEAARARVASATDEELTDARRGLRDALSRARRLREALDTARLVTAAPDAISTDWRVHAAVARAVFELDEARDALARVPGARLPSLDAALRDEMECGPTGEPIDDENADEDDGEDEYVEEDEYDDEDDERCSWTLVVRLDVSDPATQLRGIAVVQIRRGASESQSHWLVVGVDGDWHAGPRIADGPFTGNQVTGVMSFDLSDAELRQIVPGGDHELVARYHTEEMASDDDADIETDERGLLFCGTLAEMPRCARVPESIRTSDGGETSRTATATVEVEPDGSIRVTRRSGRSPRIVPGTRTFDALLDTVEDDGD